MLAARITVVAAALALLVGFAPYIDGPLGAVSLSQFTSDQPPAFWFGRAAVVLLVITAAAAFRSLGLAVMLAVFALGAASAPLIASALRGASALGWVGYAGSPPPPLLPTTDETPRWGLGALLAVAMFIVTVLVLALIRTTQPPGRTRAMIVALLGLVAVGASVALAVSYRNTTMQPSRSYVDYVRVPTDSDFSRTSAWYAVAGVVLVVLAVLVTYSRRPVSATSPSRSTR
jgi:hypothetical protein